MYCIKSIIEKLKDNKRLTCAESSLVIKWLNECRLYRRMLDLAINDLAVFDNVDDIRRDLFERALKETK